MQNLPDSATLNELLRYDPATGKLYWNQRDRRHFTSDKGHAVWNGKWACREAFTSLTPKGYRQGKVLHCVTRAHRVIWTMVHGKPPIGQIDHINHDRTDNRVENLREIDPQDNQRNMRRRGSAMGIGKFRQRWRARIMVDRREICLGTFDTAEEALEARRAAERKFGFHENHGT